MLPGHQPLRQTGKGPMGHSPAAHLLQADWRQTPQGHSAHLSQSHQMQVAPAVLDGGQGVRSCRCPVQSLGRQGARGHLQVHSSDTSPY